MKSGLHLIELLLLQAFTFAFVLLWHFKEQKYCEEGFVTYKPTTTSSISQLSFSLFPLVFSKTFALKSEAQSWKDSPHSLTPIHHPLCSPTSLQDFLIF
ncbi:hypothetical protein RJT34_25737 [Clitoria ternatea]|uniref:Uncharacterized protein n=1 Tax=Clitoria ternatea TaxID=43366 RepID=A0AAN9FQG1_CLITE